MDVVTFDQPLFALTKEIQWKCPQEYGEEKFVILLGGLHIEMAALKTLGDKYWFIRQSPMPRQQNPFCGHPMSVEPEGLTK